MLFSFLQTLIVLKTSNLSRGEAYNKKIIQRVTMHSLGSDTWQIICCTNASCLTQILNKPLSSSLKKLSPMFALG
jgi:hypothetical protein